MYMYIILCVNHTNKFNARSRDVRYTLYILKLFQIKNNTGKVFFLIGKDSQHTFIAICDSYMYLANLKVLLLKFHSYIIENKTPVQFCFIHQVFYCILFCKPLSEHFKLNIVEMVTISQGHA